MSKAFTRESDNQAEELLKTPSRLPHGAKNYYTSQGIARLRETLQKLSSQPGSPDIRQRIHELEQSLRSAVVVDPPPIPWTQVSFGATITVIDQNNVQESYHIVGVDETDLELNCISWLSPIAKALNRARIGQKVSFLAPEGESILEIVEIVYS